MVEANHTLQEAQLRARLHFATNTLALQAALNSTKRRLQAPGLKVNHFPLRELKLRAEAYLAEHREELITEAKTVVAQWQQEGYFDRGRRSNIKLCVGSDSPVSYKATWFSPLQVSPFCGKTADISVLVPASIAAPKATNAAFVHIP